MAATTNNDTIQEVSAISLSYAVAHSIYSYAVKHYEKVLDLAEENNVRLCYPLPISLQ